MRSSHSEVIAKFEELKRRLSSLEELYLSHRPRDPARKEPLVKHIELTLDYAKRLEDHRRVVAKLIRRLESLVSGRTLRFDDAEKLASLVMEFVALYHDIGKAEIQYQLYAHGRSNSCPPHNISSVAFLIEEQSVFDKFVDEATKLGLSAVGAERLFLASVLAIAMHHEYYDYRDLSFLHVLTPTTLSIAKGISLDVVLCFDETVFKLLEQLRIANDVSSLLPSGPARDICVALAKPLEFVSTLHYEFGALKILSMIEETQSNDEVLAISLSLAEALTWVLTVADNLAARHREGNGKSFYALNIHRYYG